MFVCSLFLFHVLSVLCGMRLLLLLLCVNSLDLCVSGSENHYQIHLFPKGKVHFMLLSVVVINSQMTCSWKCGHVCACTRVCVSLWVLSVQTGCSSSPGRIDMNILSLTGSTDG